MLEIDMFCFGLLLLFQIVRNLKLFAQQEDVRIYPILLERFQVVTHDALMALQSRTGSMFWDESFFVCWRKKEMKLKKENIIQNDRTGRYANYKLVKK